jgi:hypothetical protein
VDSWEPRYFTLRKHFEKRVKRLEIVKAEAVEMNSTARLRGTGEIPDCSAAW